MSSRRNLIKTLGVTLLASGGLVSVAKADKKSKNKGGNLVKGFENIRSLQQSKDLSEGDFVKVLGYFKINDGGHADYLISKENDISKSGILLENSLYAVLVNVDAVNYKMFGTVSDGNHDDGIEIKKAHNFANVYNLPVVNTSGKFWLKETNGIAILNNVEWGNTIFHIDESFNTSKAFKFDIKSRLKNSAANFSEEDKKKIIEQLKPGVSVIKELRPYSNHIVYVEDAEDKVGFRSGQRFTGQSWAKQEFFYVEEHGKILGEIAYTFKNYTSINFIPVDDTYLTVNGGCFDLSGNSSGKGYTKNGIGITRSRTAITNQVVRLEKGKEDTAPNARTGFYSFTRVYDVRLENVKLIPYEQDREGKDRDVPAGTYGISGGRMLNATFKNVTAEGSLIHWGVFGTNFNKNFKIDGCTLNRVDVHFHCWNLSILNSRIGARGISITGGGDLIIENTICENRSFVNFRRDFGAKWDGDIRINNCKHVPSPSSSSTVLDFNPQDFDYKYPIVFGRTIIIENFVVDCRYLTAKQPILMMNMCNFSKMKHGQRIIFPYHVEFRNVFVNGGRGGVTIMNLQNPQHYYVEKNGSYANEIMDTNSKILLDQVDLEDLSNVGFKVTHLNVNNPDPKFLDNNSLIPQIEFRNCKGIDINISGMASNLLISNSSISSIKANDFGAHPGEITLFNSKIKPKKDKAEDIKMGLKSVNGTSFIHCTVHSPQINNTFRPDLVNYEFLKLNSFVKYNHTNTLLGKDIQKYLKEKSIKLSPQFIGQLKIHSELED